MLNSIGTKSAISEIETPDVEQNRQYASMHGNKLERTPAGDDNFESENKTGKTIGIVAASLIVLAGIGAIFVTYRGKNVLNKADATLKEKFEAGWKDIFKKGGKSTEKATENDAKEKVVDKTDTKTKVENTDGQKPKDEISKTNDGIVQNSADTTEKGGKEVVSQTEKTTDVSSTVPVSIAESATNKTLNVKQFIRDDIKWEIPEYDKEIKVSNGTKYYKDNRLVMHDLVSANGIQKELYTYNDLGKVVVMQSKGPGGYRVHYLTETEDGLRKVMCLFQEEGSMECSMIIKDYNEFGQNIRDFQGTTTKNGGKLHEVDIHYNDKDKVCGYTEYFNDGRIWEMTKLNEFKYDITVKSGGTTINEYKNVEVVDVPTQNGEKSSVGCFVWPTGHREYKKGAGLID